MSTKPREDEHNAWGTRERDNAKRLLLKTGILILFVLRFSLNLSISLYLLMYLTVKASTSFSSAHTYSHPPLLDRQHPPDPL